MDEYLRLMKGSFFAGIQFFLATIIFILRSLGGLLREVHPTTIAGRIMSGPYYAACLAKRRARGDALWQEQDLMIDKAPPPGHPYWLKAPMCNCGCGMPVSPEHSAASSLLP